VETVCVGSRRGLDWAVERRVWRRCLDGGADKRAPRGFDFFQFFQNQVKIIKSKQMPSHDLKIPKKICETRFKYYSQLSQLCKL
jgi:hypothetical protein